MKGRCVGKARRHFSDTAAQTFYEKKKWVKRPDEELRRKELTIVSWHYKMNMFEENCRNCQKKDGCRL